MMTADQRRRDLDKRSRKVWRRYCPSCKAFRLKRGDFRCPKCGEPAHVKYSFVEVEYEG